MNPRTQEKVSLILDRLRETCVEISRLEIQKKASLRPKLIEERIKTLMEENKNYHDQLQMYLGNTVPEETNGLLDWLSGYDYD